MGILKSVDTGVVSKWVNMLAHIGVITWPDVTHPSSRNVTFLHVLVIVKLCMVIFICIGVSLKERRKKGAPGALSQGGWALCWGGGVLHRRWDKDDGFSLGKVPKANLCLLICVCVLLSMCINVFMCPHQD